MTTSKQTFIVFACLALVAFANGITRLPCKSHGDFSIILDDIKDAGPVGKTVTSETRRACALECLSWPSCKSLNFKKETNSCDLLERNLTESGINLMQDIGSVYMTTEEDQMNQGPICKVFMPCQNGGTCQDACNSKGYTCTCVPLYTGYHCENIKANSTVFQRRVSADVDFYRNWASYKVGFGDPSGNFWLGLDKLHELAKPGAGAKLRIDMKVMTGGSYYAEYSKFEVENEAAGYRLTVSGFTGNVYDALEFHNGFQWSTYDKGPNSDCATSWKGGWWYARCYHSNLNGVLLQAGQTESSINCRWRDTKDIIFVEMKVK
ncbi:ficolin-2-like isoform X1 [Rhopilema esculentum]|uniref:ficolin-2-like isoform X1 n=1 Tax=Rhopilema esculentum TaxID=499914 RepID=UPI0031DB27F4|eukprot:gene3732-15007_t